MRFRIVVDNSSVVMRTVMGGSAMTEYRTVSMHAIALNLTAGNHTAQVQCTLPRVGKVAFETGSHGAQNRQLSALRVAASA
eukprot:6264906-Prymnesium_polylepis.1